MSQSTSKKSVFRAATPHSKSVEEIAFKDWKARFKEAKNVRGNVQCNENNLTKPEKYERQVGRFGKRDGDPGVLANLLSRAVQQHAGVFAGD
jgi:hypothetical protein